MPKSVIKLLLSGFCLSQVAFGGTILLDQIGPDPSYTASSIAYMSQRFDSGHAAIDTAAIDDFSVQGTTRLVALDAVVAGGWSDSAGFSDFAHVQSWAVEIYSGVSAAALSLTGDVDSVVVSPDHVTITNPFGATPALYTLRALVTVDLSDSLVTLSQGNYWIGLIPRMDAAYGGLAVESSSFAGNYGAYQVNPGGAFPFSDARQPLGANLAYRLEGEAGEAVPEPSTIFLLLGGAAAFTLRRAFGQPGL
jgi:hypothetical protein